MFDVKVAPNCYVPREQIKLYTNYEGLFIKNLVKKYKAEEKAIDVTARKKTLSIIFLVTGEIVLSPVSLSTLNERINKEL